MIFVLVPIRRGICAACGEVAVYAKRNRATGYIRYQCANAKDEQRGKVSSRTRRTLGVSDEEVRVLVALQGGRCAICSTKIDTRGSLDHDHATNRVRGVLCRDCNLGLGWFRDDPIKLRRAAEYLDKRSPG